MIDQPPNQELEIDLNSLPQDQNQDLIVEQ
jgi:hypothetical protein